MTDNRYKIHSADNVEVSLNDNMKYAVRDISAGEKIIKYGFPIGVAKDNIKVGELVHTHNIRSLLDGKSGYIEFKPFEDGLHKQGGGTFMGYKRKNGKVGVRNDIVIIPTVGCVNGICESLSRKTGAVAYTHPYGCSQLGDDHESTRKILRGLALHPNVGGALIVSLGCENNTPESFEKLLAEWGYDKERVKFMTVQKENDELKKGEELIVELKAAASRDKRVECPVSELIIGLKCGGSDALSGITANPLVGRVSDKLAEKGASSVLTEIPESFGAENVLLARCKNKEVYDGLARVMDDFKAYYIAHGERIDENPSPGNKAGGISTLAEKSLGCVQKGGSSAVCGVVAYGERVTEKGLSVLNGPGNDIVACTALSAAGAHIILFTTGRGTPLGSAVPVIKISTNSALMKSKPNWIDFDAGELLSPSADADAAADKLLRLILQTAEGKLTASERSGFHEIAVWKNGVTL